MKIPYSKVHVNGDIIFAGRSGQIQTFNLKDGALISTWEHPDVGKVTEAVNKNAEANKAGDDGDNAPKQEEELGKEDEGKQEAEEEDGPPAKRQKTAGGDEKPAAEQNGKSGEGKAAEGQQPTKERKIKKSARSPFRVPERPIVTHLTTTPDGRYLVAVTGHDKAIWVLEHDGKGQLTQLSKRGMPKRLSAVVVTPSASGSDDTSSWQILCADKFGDAYSLPLVPSAATGPYVTRPAARPLKAPAANELTVHSKRNLEALRDQQKQLELDRQRAAGNGQEDQQAPDANDDGKPKKKKKQHKENDHKPEVDFELTLQLGHVSMLTDLVAAEREGRRYIITSDRDEHIRVSRGLPQAHVIEGFCLGHTDFVGAMAVAGPSRPDVLVSGGGDDHLIAWDWHGARQLAKADALALARTVDPDTPHVAISHIYPIVYPGDDGKQTTYIAAISEG